MSKSNEIHISSEEHGNEIVVKVKKPSLKYLDEALRIKPFPDMVALGLFPNAKEITESFAMYEAYRKHILRRVKPDAPNTLVVVVGDGHTPRTAAVFAFRSAFDCLSIDPNLRTEKNWESNINRLGCIKEFVQNVKYPFGYENVIWIFPHSHANPKLAIGLLDSIKEASKKKFGKEQNNYVIAMPCCVDLSMEYDAMKAFDVDELDSYFDYGIHSPKREVVVYG